MIPSLIYIYAIFIERRKERKYNGDTKLCVHLKKQLPNGPGYLRKDFPYPMELFQEKKLQVLLWKRLLLLRIKECTLQKESIIKKAVLTAEDQIIVCKTIGKA